MKKVLFAIFAHPDDEAFGPVGTLLREVKHGTELHLITLTSGQNGQNPDNHDDLGAVRLEEWRAAGALIGAHSMHHLGYVDGSLDNQSILEIVPRIEALIRTIPVNEPLEIELMSMDTTGITGHIDHIVASRVPHHVFYQLKDAGLPLARLRLACIPRAQTGNAPSYSFVFMEPGRSDQEIDERIDNREYLPEILPIMRTHHTQRGDGEAHIKNHGEQVAIDHFRIVS
jgi:LmbE family N-acetylglucosaminyl deacetylase